MKRSALRPSAIAERRATGRVAGRDTMRGARSTRSARASVSAAAFVRIRAFAIRGIRRARAFRIRASTHAGACTITWWRGGVKGVVAMVVGIGLAASERVVVLRPHSNMTVWRNYPMNI